MAEKRNGDAVACANFEQDLVLYYYGELLGAERNKIAAHLAGCDPCRLYLKEMQLLLPRTVQADDPPQAFWDDFSRELRHKLAAVREEKSWRQSFASLFQSWRLPALATTAVFVLALALTFGNKIWRSSELQPDDESFMEVIPMAENLEFFTTMDVLDAMDLLEFIGSQGNGTA